MSNKVIDIIKFIPYGHENGITGRELQNITHLNNRRVREFIETERMDHVILNMQDGKGYFRPTEAETDLTKRWILQEMSRARKIMKRTMFTVNMTQKEFGKIIGLTQSNVSSLESGRLKPNITN